MLTNNNKRSKIFSFIRFKKQYIKKLAKSIITLNFFKTHFYQSLHFFLLTDYFFRYKKDFLVSYVIHFCFSFSNTTLHISDATGNLKFSYSAGLFDLQGKQKIVRKLVLTHFFKVLSTAKSDFLKKNPIALHFRNVTVSNKFLIVKKLSEKFFIKNIKTFDLDSYNGCRKRKKRRK